MRGVQLVVLLPLLASRHFATPPTDVAPRTPVITVEILGLDDQFLRTLTPSVTVRATRADEDEVPVALGVRVSTTPLVLSQFVQDTSVLASESADIQLTTLLPAGAIVYFRGYARTSSGAIIYSPPTEARAVPQWLTLLSPGAPSGATIEDQSPTFVWSSGAVNAPPGPWIYDFSLSHTAGGSPLVNLSVTDTSHTIPFQLEFSTSYRWAVTARLQAQPATRVSRSSSFVIVDPATPRTTLLHNTFPNPFPSQLRSAACIWFDLSEDAVVTIDVLDLRANHVKRVFPVLVDPGVALEPGRYGREVTGANGCSPEFTWDGTDSFGRRVNPGAYLLRMRAGAKIFHRTMLFRG